MTRHFGATIGAQAGSGADCTLGDVWLSAASLSGGVPAHGQTLAIAQHSALFSLLGTNFGGDGRTTFALPDLRDVAPKSANGVGVQYYICTQGIYPVSL